MKRIAWATDIHLEFVSAADIDRFSQSIADTAPDIVLLGGDTGIGPTVAGYLTQLEQQLQRPIYFVLGNHDCYRDSIAHVRQIATHLTQSSRWLRWLPMAGVIELTPTTGLIGHDGWADGRLGNAIRSQVLLNDYFLIQELAGLAPRERFARLHALGDEAAGYFQECLPAALARWRHLLLLTHVPPFREACWHEGHIADDEFLPHFTCSAAGPVLVATMQQHPHCQLTVLCGHTHSPGAARILPNLFVQTGGAVYGNPRVQEVLAVD